jgi:hypothetical protein
MMHSIIPILVNLDLLEKLDARPNAPRSNRSRPMPIDLQNLINSGLLDLEPKPKAKPRPTRQELEEQEFHRRWEHTILVDEHRIRNTPSRKRKR